MSLRGIASCITLSLLAGALMAPDAHGEAGGAPAAAPSAPDVAMLEHPDRVASYTLKASLDPVAHTVHGEGTITWKNAARVPVRELWMHLYLNAFKNQSSTWMRAPVGGFRGVTVPKEWGTIDVRSLTWNDAGASRDLWAGAELRRKDDEDETDARVPLPRDVQPGETITLSVVWDDKLPSVVERTGFDGSFHMVAQWFPKIATIEPDGTFGHFAFQHLGEFYADYGSYDVTLDVPAAFVVGATGTTAESRVENGRRIERHVQDDVHDFAWTAWDEFRSQHETIDGVAVSILYPPGYEHQAERELAAMRFALPHFGARYGKYPYPLLTMVHPPFSADEAGGMEYPTLITTGGAAMLPDSIRINEITAIHELGHQWFYGLLASHETKWPFLDEGLNSYAEADALATWRGPGNAADVFGLSIGDAEAQSERARHAALDDRIAQPAAGFASGSIYGNLVYSRTLALLETMRRVYGADKMERAIGTYARRYRFRHPVPQDLLDTLREVLGEEPAEVARAALFDKGWVDFAVLGMSSHVTRAAAGIFDVAGKRETVPGDRETAGSFTGWALVSRRGNLKIPVEIELVSEDGSRRRVPWDSATDTIRVPYAGSSPLRAAVVDPDQRVLLDQDRTNDFMTASGHAGGGAPRMLERATYWTELLGHVVGP
ncbi:MAG: Aminopeptidase [Labilithrix sp.]|nr:Aminopeptidase [Labilithrix sp.]